MPGSNAARAPRAIVLALCATLAGCGETSTPSTLSGTALLDAAIAAHGGAAALARLDDLRVVSRVTFRERVELERRLDLRAPSSFTMTVSHDGRVAMAFGLAGEACWTESGPFTSACDAARLAENRRTLEVLGARLLHRIDRAAVRDAGTVAIDGRESPALRVGDLRLAFDPESHLLVRIDYEEENGLWIESFSRFEEHAGARIAAHRELTIGGMPDVSETWTEIVPGGADPAELEPRAPSHAGGVFDGEDGARAVVWADVGALLASEPLPDGVDRLEHVRRELARFAEEHGMRPSGTDGLLLRWREGDLEVASTLEMDRRFEPLDSPPFHVETLPAQRFVGVFCRGEDDASARSAALDATVEARGATVASGATHELLLAPGATELPPSERLGLYRIAVAR